MARPRPTLSRAIIGGTPDERRVAVAHAKDKGEKHNKKAAQKSIKEKRAAKKAKKQSTSASALRSE